MFHHQRGLLGDCSVHSSQVLISSHRYLQNVTRLVGVHIFRSFLCLEHSEFLCFGEFHQKSGTVLPDRFSITRWTIQGIVFQGIVCHVACHDGAEVSALGVKIGRSPVQISPKTNFSILIKLPVK